MDDKCSDVEREELEREIAESLTRAIDEVARQIAQKYGVDIRPRTSAKFDLRPE